MIGFMRFLKIAFAGLVTILAMMVSLMVALGVAAIGFAVYLYLRLRGKRATVHIGAAPHARPTPTANGEVIDVSATEVPAQRLER